MRRLVYLCITLTVLTCLTNGTQAQTHRADSTTNPIVVVEQEYTPLMMNAKKINTMPPAQEVEETKKTVTYTLTPYPARFISSQAIPHYTIAMAQPAGYSGYLRGGYGNYGNLDVWANNMFLITKKDRINIQLDMDGMDGELESRDAYYYRGKAEVSYTHQFKESDLRIAGDFGMSRLNLIPEGVFQKQRFTHGGIHAGVHSTQNTALIGYKAETNVMFYQRKGHYLNATSERANMQELSIHSIGELSGTIDARQTVTMTVVMDNFLYTGKPTQGEKYHKSYTALTVSPLYEIHSDNVKLRLGGNIDIGIGFDKSLRVSPQVEAEYVFARSYTLYAKALGGRESNTFSRLESICPYGDSFYDLENDSFTILPYHTYTQADAGAGLKAGFYPGVWLHLFGGFKTVKNDMLYTALETGAGTSMSFIQADNHAAYFGGEFKGEYKDVFSFSACCLYYDWGCEEELLYLLYTKPEIQCDLALYIRPIKPLQLRIGYDYIRYRKEDESLKLEDITDLHIGLDYNLWKGLYIYAKAQNLLNKEYEYFPLYEAEKINFVAGLHISF